MKASENGLLAVLQVYSVCSCTCDGGVVAVLFAVAVLLSICVLLRVLQTQFMANLERLADGPNNTHGLTLGGWGEEDKQGNTHVILRT